MPPCSRFETCWFQVYLLSVTLQLFQNLLVSGIFVISHLVVASELAGFMYISYRSPCSCFRTCWFHVYLLSVALQLFQNLLVSGIFVISRLVVVSELAGFRYICYQSPCSCFRTCWFQVYLLSVTLQLFQNLPVSGIFVISRLVVVSNLLVSGIFVISRLVVVSELAGFMYICYQSPCSRFRTCQVHVYLLSVTLQLFQNLLGSCIFVISRLVVVSELARFMYICYQSPCSRFGTCWFQVYLLSVTLQSFRNLLGSCIFVISRLVVVSELARFMYICYQSPCSRFGTCWFQVYLLSVTLQLFQNLLVSCIFLIGHLVVVSELAGFRYICYQSPCSCFRTCWFHIYLFSVALQLFQNLLVSRYICYQSPCSRFRTCWFQVYLLSVTLQLFQNLLVSGIFLIGHLVVASELAGFRYICYQSPCSCFRTCWFHVYLLSVALQLFQNLLVSGIFVISRLVVVSEFAGFRYICYQSPCSRFRTCWVHVYLLSVALQSFQNLLVSCIFVISHLVVVSELAGFMYISYRSPCSCFRTCWFQVYLLSVALQLFQNLLVSRYICYQSPCSCFRTCWFQVYLLSVALQLFQNLLV